MEIKAISGNHILINNGKPVVIGSISSTLDGVSKIIFDFGTKQQDIFVFENNTLKEYKLALRAPDYINKIYANCINSSLVTEFELIRLVVDAFTYRELGF
ncbi:MAG: hypothetical protein H7141_12375 [Burkholderiales bacterium]|nr:hypothetical protein [Bacteroidia bacterium]